jgi:HTH-type transcriptional regulator/antitoxin HigA
MAEGETLERDWTVVPGDTLRELLAERELSQAALARATGYTVKHVNFVIQGRARITAEFAVALEAALGTSAAFWMNLQAGYDVDIARGRRVFP